MLTEVTIMSGVPRTSFQRCPGYRFAAHSLGEFRGVVVRTIRHSQAADAAIAQMLDYLLGHRARADDQRAVTLQISEDPLGELHARQSHRHRPRAHFGFRTHALAHFERALKRAVQHWSGGAVVERLSVCGAELA